MKKTISVIISVLLLFSLTLLTGCGESAVFEKSEKAAQNKVVLKEDKSYTCDDLKFSLNTIQEVEDASELDTPQGKWVEVVLKTSTPSSSAVDTLVKGENILLNGAAASDYTFRIPAGTPVSLSGGSLNPSSYEIAINYDVPTDFNVETAKVTCSDIVTESKDK